MINPLQMLNYYQCRPKYRVEWKRL